MIDQPGCPWLAEFSGLIAKQFASKSLACDTKSGVVDVGAAEFAPTLSRTFSAQASTQHTK
jgi:hypothetical protein